MNKTVALGLCLVIGAELAAIALPERRFVLWASGAAVALVLLAVRMSLAHEIEPAPPEPVSNDGESLRRWVSRTEILIHWSESTRADWDRHLRPRLAREFEMATGERHAKDRAAARATGLMLFGAELWQWVDPDNVVRTGRSEPGPGRAALDKILQRLEQI